jgi:hypothetical protein
VRLVVLQSSYIPWKGYFDLLDSADLFVVYDSVQYTKNDWRNRNVLVGADGPIWLTIPIETAGRAGQSIAEATVSDPRWARKHWTTVQQSLGRRPYFASYADEWETWYSLAAKERHLHDINGIFLRGLADQLGITTRVVDDTDLPFGGESPTARLVSLCRAAGATTYLTGPAGLRYMDLDQFRDAAIAVEVIDYSAYPIYSQRVEQFTHGVSVLDVLANTGGAAASHLLGNVSRVC